MQDVSPSRVAPFALFALFVLLWPIEVWLFDNPLGLRDGPSVQLHMTVIAVHAGIGVCATALSARLGLNPARCARGLFALFALGQVALVLSGIGGFRGFDGLLFVMLLSLFQFVWAVSSLAFSARYERNERWLGLRVLAGMLGIAWSLGTGVVALAAGASWGRPLRIRGRQLHPNLKRGADWTRGERPDPRGLDHATRAALEALWLHDAQKEHASVPAFSRISWLLTAVGAPAPLLAWCHRAALEEIDHAERCFALAAGYAGRSFTVDAMPELLLCNYEDVKDPW